ncbi:MAG: DUF1015 family protein [Myxococcota bacterium]
MSVLEPFAGVRPPTELVLKVAAPPYDVVNAQEARAYAAGNAYSFFHISRPEIDFPPGTDEHAEEVYHKGLENLRRFMTQGWLRADDGAHFYLYQQRMGSHVQVGLVAGASVDEYNRGLIKKHELTRQDKEDDRTRHVDVLNGNDEPVFLTYRARAEIDALVRELCDAQPHYDFTTEDGIGHTFWVVPPAAGARLKELFLSVPHLYIADGHHRSAAAARVARIRRDRGHGSGEHDRFLAVIFPHNQMQIMDYNRVVKDLRGHTPQSFRLALENSFEVSPTWQKKPRRVHEFGMYLSGRWWRLRARPGTYDDTPLGVLDVNVLQNNVLRPLLGIEDPRTDKRIHFVGGIRGMRELEKLVDSGEYAVAFAMFPTTMDQLMAIADAGEIMPPKSTWFEPKLRSGLVLHLF